MAASAAASFSGRAAPADSPLPAQGPPQMTEQLKRTLKVSCCCTKPHSTLPRPSEVNPSPPKALNLTPMSFADCDLACTPDYDRFFCHAKDYSGLLCKWAVRQE